MTVVQLSVGWVPTHQSVAMGYHPSYVRCGGFIARALGATGHHRSAVWPDGSVGWVPTHQSGAADANLPQRTESAESRP